MIGPRAKRQYRIRLGGVIYIFIAVVIGLAAFNSQTNLLFWAFGLMLGGLVVSGTLSGFMMLGLRVRRRTPEQAMCDRPLTVQYELINQKRLLPCFGLEVEELRVNARLHGRPHAYALHVGPGATGRAEAVVWPRHRGKVRFDQIRISTAFPLGIIRKSILLDQPSQLTVCPKVYRLKRSLLASVHARDPEGTRATQESDGGEEFCGLREYRPGDSLRFIHWRHSARIGRLVSREMTRLSPPRVMVVLDVRGEGEGERAEQALSLAASLLEQAHRGKDEVGLMVMGAKSASFLPQHSRWHVKRMQQALGELVLGETDEEAEAAHRPAVRDARWVVVHAGQVDASVGGPRALHLSAADLPDYVEQAPSERREAGTAASEEHGDGREGDGNARGVFAERKAVAS